MNELVVRCIILIAILLGVFAFIQFCFFLFLQAFRFVDNYVQDRYWKKLDKSNKEFLN